MKNSVPKRLLALLLCMAMLVPYLNTLPLQAWAFPGETGTTTEEPLAVVGAGSDFQYDDVVYDSKTYENKYLANQAMMEDLLNNIKLYHSRLDAYFLCGDYDSRATSAAASSAGLAACYTALNNVYGLTYDQIQFVQGNHDPADTVGLDATGAHEADHYSVYQINHADFSWEGGDLETTQTTAANLDAFLDEKAEAGYRKPIFVISHLHLHHAFRTLFQSDTVDNQYARYLVDVMNEGAQKGLNIVYMYGHNHSGFYDQYLGRHCVYPTPGTAMPVTDPTKGLVNTYEDVTLGFTYMNAGYVGYPLNGVSSTVFEIYEDRMEINRYGITDVLHLKNAGSSASAIDSRETWPPNTTVVESPHVTSLSDIELSVVSNTLGKPMIQGTTGQIQLAVTSDNPYNITWEATGDGVVTLTQDTANPALVTVTAGNPGTSTISAIARDATYPDTPPSKLFFEVSVAPENAVSFGGSGSLYQLVTDWSTISSNKRYMILNTDQPGEAVAMGTPLTDVQADRNKDPSNFQTKPVVFQLPDDPNTYVLPANGFDTWILETKNDNTAAYFLHYNSNNLHFYPSITKEIAPGDVTYSYPSYFRYATAQTSDGAARFSFDPVNKEMKLFDYYESGTAKHILAPGSFKFSYNKTDNRFQLRPEGDTTGGPVYFYELTSRTAPGIWAWVEGTGSIELNGTGETGGEIFLMVDGQITTIPVTTDMLRGISLDIPGSQECQLYYNGILITDSFSLTVTDGDEPQIQVVTLLENNGKLFRKLDSHLDGRPFVTVASRDVGNTISMAADNGQIVGVTSKIITIDNEEGLYIYADDPRIIWDCEFYTTHYYYAKNRSTGTWLNAYADGTLMDLSATKQVAWRRNTSYNTMSTPAAHTGVEKVATWTGTGYQANLKSADHGNTFFFILDNRLDKIIAYTSASAATIEPGYTGQLGDIVITQKHCYQDGTSKEITIPVTTDMLGLSAEQLSTPGDHPCQVTYNGTVICDNFLLTVPGAEEPQIQEVTLLENNGKLFRYHETHLDGRPFVTAIKNDTGDTISMAANNGQIIGLSSNIFTIEGEEGLYISTDDSRMIWDCELYSGYYYYAKNRSTGTWLNAYADSNLIDLSSTKQVAWRRNTSYVSMSTPAAHTGVEKVATWNGQGYQTNPKAANYSNTVFYLEDNRLDKIVAYISASTATIESGYTGQLGDIVITRKHCYQDGTSQEFTIPVTTDMLGLSAAELSTPGEHKCQVTYNGTVICDNFLLTIPAEEVTPSGSEPVELSTEWKFYKRVTSASEFIPNVTYAFADTQYAEDAIAMVVSNTTDGYAVTAADTLVVEYNGSQYMIVKDDSWNWLVSFHSQGFSLYNESSKKYLAGNAAEQLILKDAPPAQYGWRRTSTGNLAPTKESIAEGATSTRESDIFSVDGGFILGRRSAIRTDDHVFIYRECNEITTMVAYVDNLVGQCSPGSDLTAEIGGNIVVSTVVNGVTHVQQIPITLEMLKLTPVQQNTPGEYTCTVYYNGQPLTEEYVLTISGEVPEAMIELPGNNDNIISYVATVDKMTSDELSVGTGGRISTGSTICLYTYYADGTVEISEDTITVDMLKVTSNQLNNAGTYTDVTLVYKNLTITDDYTLRLVDVVYDNYPDFPNEGSVKVDKQLDTTKFNYLQTGSAQIDLSVAGIPTTSEANVVIVLDASGSMALCTHDIHERPKITPEQRAIIEKAFSQTGTLTDEEITYLRSLSFDEKKENASSYIAKMEALINGTISNSDWTILRQGMTEYGWCYKGDAWVGSTEGSCMTRAQVTREALTELLEYLKSDIAGYDMDIDVAVSYFNYDYPMREDLHFLNAVPPILRERDPKEIMLPFTNAEDVNVSQVVDMYKTASGTNYDRGMELAYQLLADKQTQDYQEYLGSGSTDPFQPRKDFVLFMSDGAPSQFNYMVTNNAGTFTHFHNGNLDDTLDQYVDASVLPIVQGLYHPDGKMWLAEAIKGDKTETYKVIDPTKPESNYISSTMGLGATMMTVSLNASSAGNVLTRIATGPEFYYPTETGEDIRAAFNAFGSLVTTGTGAAFKDQMGEEFDLQMKNTIEPASIPDLYNSGTGSWETYNDQKTTKTVYYDNSVTGWENVCVYTWDSSDQPCTGDWPGTRMTHLGNGVCAFEIPANATGILFNDGRKSNGFKTVDLTVPTDGKMLFRGGSSNTPSGKRTIYFDNTGTGWSKINIYAWDDVTGQYTGGWPGSGMTKVSGNIYSYEVSTNATEIIFNNGSAQTGDLPIPSGANMYRKSDNLWMVNGNWHAFGTQTVYFNAEGCNWSNISCYTWGGGNISTTGTWPGAKMIHLGGDMYSCEIPAGITGLNFNNGNNGSQTTDLTLPGDGSNQYSYASGAWSNYDTRTIYFNSNGTDWSQVYAYTWDENQDYTTAAWPGMGMTHIGGGIYSVKVPADTERVTFSDGADHKIENLSVPPTTIELNSTITVSTYELYKYSEHLQNPTQVTMDMVGKRKGTEPTVLEQVTFSDDGTKAYSNLIDGGNTNILIDGVICAKNFWYNTNTGASVKIDTDGNGTTDTLLESETFYWNVGGILEDELVLSYNVYLTGTLEGTRGEGSYATNEYASLHYTNHLGNDCVLNTTSPMLPWNQAVVGYAFYLVDANGDPLVNEDQHLTGSFEKAIRMTQPQYIDLLYNSSENVTPWKLEASAVLPEGYSLYDPDAAYHVALYANGNGSWQVTGEKSKLTTYVTGYGGVPTTKPNATAGMSGGGQSYDYPAYATASTVVWFAVRADVNVVPDTVVIDYGISVDIHVLGNDVVITDQNSVIAGIGAACPTDSDGDGVVFSANLAEGFGPSFTGEFGTATIRGNAIRYTPNTLQMTAEDTFAYSANYQGEKNSGYYYAQVTVIPATSIYYEDNFITFDENWTQTGTTVGGVQDEDRLGTFNLPQIDANNVYGYDSAYTDMQTFSMGSAMKATLDAVNCEAVAEFTFTGTGFDIISYTGTNTGTVMLTVERQDGPADADRYLVVDTYYATSDGLYQVPIMKVKDLPYGTYRVELYVGYGYTFDHQHDGSYDFYLDAVRIYNPTNNGEGNALVQDAYVSDGEGWPIYQELRNLLIDANTFDSLGENDEISGVVFIDGNAALDSGSAQGDGKDELAGKQPAIVDYANFGPNNELYLAPGQAVAFRLNVNAVDPNVAGIHLGLKSVGGTAVAKVYNANVNHSNVKERRLSGASQQYFDITDLNGQTVVIWNVGTDSDAILSVTDLKTTYQTHPVMATGALLSVNYSSAQNAMASMMAVARTPEPQLTPKYPSLAFEGEIKYVVYFDTENLGDVSTADLGLATFTTADENGTVETAADVTWGATEADGLYAVSTKGVAAKDMGDRLYFKVVARLSDGSYAYSQLRDYSALDYAENALATSTDPAHKALVVAMLNYGTQAQHYFGYNTDQLMNATVSAQDQALLDGIHADDLDAQGTVDASKVANFRATGGFAQKYPAVTFDGAFLINYNMIPAQRVDTVVKLYLWNEDTYNTVAELTADNADRVIIMAAEDGHYQAASDQIVAKDLDKTVYAAAVYEADGTTCCTGVLAYSIGSYCRQYAADEASEMNAFAEAAAIYGCSAKAYFGE